jgi:hypothetical protein
MATSVTPNTAKDRDIVGCMMCGLRSDSQSGGRPQGWQPVAVGRAPRPPEKEPH